jgi:hypothetical protein
VDDEFERLTKYDLHLLADRLLEQDQAAIDRCVLFVLAETRGLWHGRARAMMCRRLKHCTLGTAQCGELVVAITARLEAGAFSEQFRDQLRLAMHLDYQRTIEVCRNILASPRRLYVRRYAQWALSAGRRPT